MARYTDEQKAHAVARVHTGESVNKVASDIGCSRASLKEWLDKVPQSGTEKTVSERVSEITEQIEQKQAETRKALIDRIGELVPECGSLKDVATAYGILTDKMLVAQGKPTQIQGQAIAIGDGTPEELERTVDELRKRRERSGATHR